MFDFQANTDATGGVDDFWSADNSTLTASQLIPQERWEPLLEPIVLRVLPIDQYESGVPDRVEEIAEARLALLAESYLEKNHNYREIKARLQIVERELDVLEPRYTQDDWKLLKKFQDSLDKLERV